MIPIHQGTGGRTQLQWKLNIPESDAIGTDPISGDPYFRGSLVHTFVAGTVFITEALYLLQSVPQYHLMLFICLLTYTCIK